MYLKSLEYTMYSSNALTFFICGSLHISICMCIYVYVCIYVNMDLILASKPAVINCCILNFYLSNTIVLKLWKVIISYLYLLERKFFQRALEHSVRTRCLLLTVLELSRRSGSRRASMSYGQSPGCWGRPSS